MIKRKLRTTMSSPASLSTAVAATIAAAMLPAGAALADVRAGVEAWGRGDYPAAVREWQGPSDKGDPDAQFNLGQAYKLGRGVKPDLAKAEELFGKAAAKGHIQASDMYGLLLFQRGERARALPYLRAAADRGEPRAQYLLGVAYFNGDNVPKNWVRAYALTSLARQAGVDQAQNALAQMDLYIPLEQRQQGAALATELASQADATRARQLAAVDLGATVPATAAPAAPTPSPALTPLQARTATSRPSGPAATATEAAAVARLAAGADYARPRGPAAAPPTPTVAAAPTTTPRPAPKTTPPAVPMAKPAPAASGPWRVQLGAFSVAGNASALWNRVKDRPELAGRERLTPVSGRITRLLAGGFPSRDAAQSACTRLSAAGFDCLVTRN